jgi:predicted DNA-binding transcriptional regulator AlpA
MRAVFDGEKVAYRINEFCALTGLSRSTIYLEIAAGRLKAIKW